MDGLIGLPAHCDNCGLFFISRAIGGSGAVRHLTIENVTVSCPRCGHGARAIDGTFDFVGNAIRVRRAPPQTLAILEVLQEALRAAQAGASQEEIARPIERVSPELAARAGSLISRFGLHAFVYLLIWLLKRST